MWITNASIFAGQLYYAEYNDTARDIDAMLYLHSPNQTPAMSINFTNSFPAQLLYKAQSLLLLIGG